MMRLALYQPDIPQNLGAALRLSAAFAVELDVIEPCGFPLGDKAIRRAQNEAANARQRLAALERKVSCPPDDLQPQKAEADVRAPHAAA